MKLTEAQRQVLAEADASFNSVVGCHRPGGFKRMVRVLGDAGYMQYVNSYDTARITESGRAALRMSGEGEA